MLQQKDKYIYISPRIIKPTTQLDLAKCMRFLQYIFHYSFVIRQLQYLFCYFTHQSLYNATAMSIVLRHAILGASPNVVFNAAIGLYSTLIKLPSFQPSFRENNYRTLSFLFVNISHFIPFLRSATIYR